MKWLISTILLFALAGAILYAPILQNKVEADWRIAKCAYQISQLEEDESLKTLSGALYVR